MKVPGSWLREWIGVPWEARELGSRLTMAGFELEGVEPAAPPFSNVVVAQILEASKHPQADKLQVCSVTTGQGEPLQIVCGASNARKGLKTALAQVGAVLPGDLKIKAAKLRGVESNGMLCSAKELGLAETSTGIIELPEDAPLGQPVREYLALDDTTLELNITPNRGDAMSIIGVAREVAALTGQKISGPQIDPVPARIDDQFPVRLDAPAACPKFAGRVIRGVNNRAPTPLWMRERLRRAGLRSISPVVDVTNYVLLELGQPMHAYDMAKLTGGIHVRFAKDQEPITLLDGRDVALTPNVLVIADDAGPVGVAGIMGGERTSISEGTTDVFLEVAYFSPDAIAGRARGLGLQTDASQRFERGVDPAGQERAIERATALILQIAGGSAGPVVVTQKAEHLPRRTAVRLRHAQLTRLLGVKIDAKRVEEIFTSLEMQVRNVEGGWEVTPPSHRFDINIEADLIEEVARIYGLDAIPEVDAPVAQRFRPIPESQPPEHVLLDVLASRGYHEAITYAFGDAALQARLFPDTKSLALANPIASDLSVMRVSLWPGLLRAALENQKRQQDRIRLFEHGTRFAIEGDSVKEIEVLAGIALGPRLPEQWGQPREAKVPVDFYDVKADLETLFAATGEGGAFTFEPLALSCLHPGRAARILRRGVEVGRIGELHPSLVRELEFAGSPILFELDLPGALEAVLPRFAQVSRFPQVRRDIAILVEETVPVSALRERIFATASRLLKDLRVFDVYRGPGVESGLKSIALGLIFQDISRTLTDEDVEQSVASIVADLRAQFGARIRE